MTERREEPLGATWLGGSRTSFLVWAPHAKQVELQLLGPGKQLVPMEPLPRGYFYVVANAPPGARYCYRLDSGSERPDPASRLQPEGVHAPSEVVDARFEWSDAGWRGIPLETYVFYELHVAAFTPEGTLEAIIPRLARLKDLGITAIEIMPVQEFPGNRNWGYDGTYPYSVHHSYGGPAGLKRVVDACHRVGLAVVLDVVYNHLGPEGNYFGDFAPYFTDVYQTPWGNALNFDGPGSDEVRRYFLANALQWVDEFHIDALRLDAVHAIIDPSACPFLHQLAEVVHHRARQLDRQIHLIAESGRNDANVIRPAQEGGWDMDASWNDDFHHALHVALTGERNGYFVDFHGVEDLARSLREGYVFSGQYSEHRRCSHGNSSKGVPGKRLVVCAQNHDQVGNRMMGNRLADMQNFERLKLGGAAVLLSPFLPLLFMGEEYGEIAPFPYFVSHSDPELIEAVRQGRGNEFKEFKWVGSLPDPESEETFAASKLNWELQEKDWHRLLWEFHRELLRMRREIPALASLDVEAVDATVLPNGRTMMMRRGSKGSRVIVVFQFGEQPEQVSIELPRGHWEKVLDSATPRWGGAGSEIPEVLRSAGNMHLQLKPSSVFVVREAE
jgi:maltooligosyltrehalose trehalohydrolase